MRINQPIFDGPARCAEVGGDQFYPDDFSTGGATVLYEQARRVCMSCEVRLECAEWAITHNEEYGMWGGLTPRERKEIRGRRLRLARAA